MLRPRTLIYMDKDKSKRIIVQDTLSRNCCTDDSESKHSNVNIKLSQSCSTNEDKSKGSIVNKKLLQIFFTNDSESKQSIVNENLSQICSTNGTKSKHSIVNETLSQNFSEDKDNLSSTEEYQSRCAIEKKGAKDKVSYDVTNYFNTFHVFESGINLFGRLDLSYERACMAIQSTNSNPAILDSEEQVDAESKSEEQIDAISNSKKQIDAMSEEKAYREEFFRNEFETISRINPES